MPKHDFEKCISTPRSFGVDNIFLCLLHVCFSEPACFLCHRVVWTYFSSNIEKEGETRDLMPVRIKGGPNVIYEQKSECKSRKAEFGAR